MSTPGRILPFAPPALLAVLCSLAPAGLQAHGDDLVLIEALTAELARAPEADLFIRRGELHRHHQEWTKAEADFADAARLDPKLAIVDYFRARTWLEAGAAARARPCIDRYVAAAPAEAEGWFLRGEVLAALGERVGAAAAYATGLQRTRQPRPEHFLRRAQLLAQSAEPADTALELAALDDGIARLGPVISLVDRAIALELARDNPTGALARIAIALENAPRREAWLVRQGEVLAQCGRTTEAVAAYRAGLAAIDELPERYRVTVPIEKLGRDARAALARLAGPEITN